MQLFPPKYQDFNLNSIVILACAGTLETVDLSGNIYDPSLDDLGKELIHEGKGKPLVVLPSFSNGPFIHDDDP